MFGSKQTFRIFDEIIIIHYTKSLIEPNMPIESSDNNLLIENCQLIAKKSYIFFSNKIPKSCLNIFSTF